MNILYPIECSKDTEAKNSENPVENQGTGSIKGMTYEDQSMTESKNEPDVSEPPQMRPKRKPRKRRRRRSKSG